MHRMIATFGLLSLLAALPGCGDNSSANPLPANAGTPEYARETSDKMKSMYGTPKVEKGGMSASDRMKAMYGH